jgi:hypothetical protein
MKVRLLVIHRPLRHWPIGAGCTGQAETRRVSQAIANPTAIANLVGRLRAQRVPTKAFDSNSWFFK